MPNTENSTEQSYFSKVEPLSHFFIEPGAFTQNASKAFGPVSGNETEQYRLTTKFTVSAQPKAFAICKGTVLVQPQTGSTTKVNLILKPFIQPIQGISIKYFIYRGLLLSDFFSGDNVLADTATSSDYIKKINEDFRNFHEGSTSMPIFKAKFVGYNPTAQANSLLLDSLFFKKTEFHEVNGVMVEDADTAFELPMIDIGKYLGRFATGDCGLDIVINYGDYKLPEGNDDEFTFTLGYARSADAILDLTGDTDVFRRKRKREHIYQFLDAAAFFGFHCCEKGIVVADNAGTKQQKKGTQIYTDLLQPFVTKNKLYLYIQSDRGRSYNFYGNYDIDSTTSKCLKIGEDESNMVETEFCTNDWPLLIIESEQTHNKSKNNILLQFITDKNENTVLYGQIAEIANAQKNNFCRANNLFVTSELGIVEKFTRFITLSNPSIEKLSNKIFVSTFNLLLYNGSSYLNDTFIEADTIPILYNEPTHVQDIFDLVDKESNSKNTGYTVISSEKAKLANFYINELQIGAVCLKTSKIYDVISGGSPVVEYHRVTFITEALDILNQESSTSKTISSSSKTSTSLSSIQKNTFSLTDPFFFVMQSFTDCIERINGIRIELTDKKQPNKNILGLSKDEFLNVKSLLDINVTNGKLYLASIDSSGGALLSNEGVSYKKYIIGLLAENSVGELKISFPAEETIVYSLDDMVFFSKEYTKYVVSQPILRYTIEKSL